MQRVKQVMSAVAAACLMAPVAALAWPVDGSVVCGNTADGVQGVEVTIGYAGHPDYSSYTTVTDGAGLFSVIVPDALTDASVHLQYGTYSSDLTVEREIGVPIGPFSIPLDWCAPPPPPCAELEAIKEGPFCVSKPIGDPTAECGRFGLVPTGQKDDGTGGLTFTSTASANVAIVKAANCYNVTVQVSKGEILNAPYLKGISHVTYCSCPAQ